MWPKLLDIAQMPRVPAGATESDIIRILNDEAEITAAFRQYHLYYEAGEMDLLMDVFTEDCVVVNPRGTFIGREAEREYLAYLCRRQVFHLHLATNVMVRVVGRDEAWLSAYWHGMSVIDEGTVHTDGWGTYINHFRKEDRWRIAEQRTAPHWPAMNPSAEEMRRIMPTDEALPTMEVRSMDLIPPVVVPQAQ
jgi:ketosteroid isomerase-like protein